VKSLNKDTNKPKLDLILGKFGETLIECAKVLGQGKYPKNNWALSAGTKDHEDFRDRNLASLTRHLIAYSQGEKRDQESNQLHSAHIMVRAAFAVYYDLKNHKPQ
jgi:hypothetical protein